MAKANTLNSLVNNLAHSYFSTMNYYDQGYLSDWIVNSTKEISVDKIEIDILKRRIIPEQLEIHPLLFHIDALQNIIKKTLHSNSLPDDFIDEVKFQITVDHINRIICCEGYAKGTNGKIYSSKPYFEKSFEIFTALNPPYKEKIERKAKSFIGRLRFILWRKFKIGKLQYKKRLEQ